MGKVGRFVTDPKAGAYCHITLDNGDKIIVSHDKGGYKGGAVTISELKWWGLASGEMLGKLDLDSPGGKAVLARLTQGAAPETARSTPLGAVVEYVKDCKSIADVRSRWAQSGA
jgi:hypothetical protein